MMAEVCERDTDVIGLQHYNAFYMTNTDVYQSSDADNHGGGTSDVKHGYYYDGGGSGGGKSDIVKNTTVCLLLKQNRDIEMSEGRAASTPVAMTSKTSGSGLMRSARIYFTGNMLRSRALVDVLKTEAIHCAHGFPCDALSHADLGQTSVRASATATNRAPLPLSKTGTSIFCRVTFPAVTFRQALKNFMIGDTCELVHDARNTKGNGLAFRAISNEGPCVGLLYLLRDNVMLMEQPLLGTSSNTTHGASPSPSPSSSSPSRDDNVGPHATLFVLDVTVMRTVLGLTTNDGYIELAFKECQATGHQRGTLAYHNSAGKKQSSDRENLCHDHNSSVLTACFCVAPTGGR